MKVRSNISNQFEKFLGELGNSERKKHHYDKSFQIYYDLFSPVVLVHYTKVLPRLSLEKNNNVEATLTNM